MLSTSFFGFLSILHQPEIPIQLHRFLWLISPHMSLFRSYLQDFRAPFRFFGGVSIDSCDAQFVLIFPTDERQKAVTYITSRRLAFDYDGAQSRCIDTNEDGAKSFMFRRVELPSLDTLVLSELLANLSESFALEACLPQNAWCGHTKTILSTKASGRLFPERHRRVSPEMGMRVGTAASDQVPEAGCRQQRSRRTGCHQLHPFHTSWGSMDTGSVYRWYYLVLEH